MAATRPAASVERLREWLWLEVLNPGRSAILVAPVAVALGFLALSTPARRVDRPLTDIVTAATLGADAAAPLLYVVGIERWTAPDLDPATGSDRNAAARAASRREIAALLRALGEHGVRAVGLDIELASATEPGADSELAQAMALLPAVHVACGVPADGGAEAIHPAFAGAGRCALAHVLRDPDGVTRSYGVAGRVGESLAARLAASLAPSLQVPTTPFLVGRPDASAVAPVLPLARFLEEPALLGPFPRDAVWLVGLAGPARPPLDQHVVVSPGGYEIVPGVEVHALAAARLVGGRAVVEPGVLVTSGCLLGALAAWAAIATGLERLLRPRVRSAGALPMALAGLVAPLGLALSCLVALSAGILISPLALVSGPLALELATYPASLAARRLCFRRGYRAALRGAPGAVVRSLEAGVVTAEPRARLARLVGAYEDLVYYLACARIATSKVTGKRAAEARSLWHAQHTLPSVLGTLGAVDPEAAEEVQGRSRLGDDPATLEAVRRHLRVRWRSEPGAPFSDLQALVRRLRYRNVFVLVRNALAHDTAAWIEPRAAAHLTLVLERQVRRILAGPTVAERLARAGSAFSQVDLHPWLIAEPDPGRGRARLFRYRGLAERVLWPEGDRGPVAMAAYGEFGPARRGLPERLLLPLAEVREAMPEELRPDAGLTLTR